MIDTSFFYGDGEGAVHDKEDLTIAWLHRSYVVITSAFCFLCFPTELVMESQMYKEANYKAQSPNDKFLLFTHFRQTNPNP